MPDQSSGHTPGPWSWWTSNSWRRLKRDDQGIAQNVLEPYICSDGHPDCSITQADMRLIAAAPDMHAALQRALDWLASYPGGGTEAAYDQARAALDKAEKGGD